MIGILGGLGSLYFFEKVKVIKKYSKILAFSIALTLLFFTKCFAAVGKGYRIIDHEIHRTTGSNFQVEEINPRLAPKNTSNDTLLYTAVPNVDGTTNQNIFVEAYHDITIHNTTGQKQIYEITVSIHCINMDNSFIDHVEIDPDGYYVSSKRTFGTVQQSNEGNYDILGLTKVSGESSGSSTYIGKLNIH